MSLALNPIKPVRILDPLLDINSSREYGVLVGPQRTSWKPIVSTTYSNNNAVFSAPPPSPFIGVDRHVKIKMPITINFSATANTNSVLLNTGKDAPPSYPISSITESLNLQINNTTTSINTRDVIKPMLWFNNCIKLTEGNMSTTPTLQDQSQTYESLFQTNRNVLGDYGESMFESSTGRGGFPVQYITNENLSAQVLYTPTEDIFLSPLSFGTEREEESAFIGVQTFQLTFNWSSDLTKLVWKHIDPNNTITNFSIDSVVLGQPTLLFKYVTPNLTQPLPEHREYSYWEVQRYPTQSSILYAPNQLTTISSSNIQLNSIPRHMYILARRPNNEMDFDKTDSYFAIEKISINWNNASSLLSNASQEDLYRMSVKNGCRMSWSQWSGKTLNKFSGSENLSIVGPSSILCVEFSTDLSLGNPAEAPGMNGTYQLQMNVDIRNVHPTDSIQPTLYIIIVNEGIYVIENNSSYSQIGVLSRNDVLNAQKQVGINYNDLRMMSGTGIFGSSKKLKRRLKKGYKGFRKGLSEVADISRDIKQITDVVNPLAQALPRSQAAEQEYYDQPEGKGLYLSRYPDGMGYAGALVGGYANKGLEEYHRRYKKLRKKYPNYSAERIRKMVKNQMGKEKKKEVKKKVRKRCPKGYRKTCKKKGGALISRNELNRALMDY